MPKAYDHLKWCKKIEKIQQLFMIKILKKKKQNQTKIKNRGALPQDNTDFSKEPTDNIILNGEKKKHFS